MTPGLVSLVIGETGRPRARSAKGPAPVQYSSRWEDGRLGPVVEGCDGEPDLTLRISPSDARLVADGELAPSVAFMQGRLKTEGDNALLLRVLAFSVTPAFDQMLRGLLAQR